MKIAEGGKPAGDRRTATASLQAALTARRQAPAPLKGR
jgi:hypothetical protein